MHLLQLCSAVAVCLSHCSTQGRLGAWVKSLLVFALPGAQGDELQHCGMLKGCICFVELAGVCQPVRMAAVVSQTKMA